MLCSVLRTLALLVSISACASAAEPQKPEHGYAWGLAQDAAISALKENDARFEEAKAEWATDSASYQLFAHRYGDFLVLMIARGTEKYAGAINLSAVKEIRLHRGHEADLKGSLLYQLSLSSNGDGFFPYNPPLRDNEPAPKGSKYVVQSIGFEIPKQRRLIDVQRPTYAQSCSGMGTMTCQTVVGGQTEGGSYIFTSRYGNYPGPAVDGIVRAAEDDQIILAGVATIFVPHGKGEGVRKAILDEIARGYSPPHLPAGR